MTGGAGTQLWRRWFVTVSGGEVLGFCAPAAMAPAATPAAGWGLVVAAGALEGVVLGLAQVSVLRRVLPRRVTQPWTRATAAAAALAWLLGMLPQATQDVWSTWPVPALAVTGSVLGSVVLLSIGTTQAWLLPQALPRAWRWIGWSVGGWVAGLAAFAAVTTPLWQTGQEMWLVVLIGALGAAAMASVMAAVTGLGLVRMTRAGSPGTVLPMGSVPGGENRNPDLPNEALRHRTER